MGSEGRLSPDKRLFARKQLSLEERVTAVGKKLDEIAEEQGNERSKWHTLPQLQEFMSGFKSTGYDSGTTLMQRLQTARTLEELDTIEQDILAAESRLATL